MAKLFQHFYPERVAALSGPQMGCWRYNDKNLAFLQEQMGKLNLLQGISEALEAAQDADEGSTRASCYANLRHAMSLWEMLVGHHAAHFQLDEFYTAAEAQHIVQTICGSFKAFAEAIDHSDLGIEDRVPQMDVDYDGSALEDRLGYVLGLEDCSFDDLPKDIHREWRLARRNHEQRMDSLNRRNRIICIEDLDVGDCISGSLYRGTLRRRNVAVKVFFDDSNSQDFVGLARFYTQMSRMERINSSGVVCLRGFTRCGKVVMEMGEGDILTWLVRTRSGELNLKLHLLKEASLALADVHFDGIAHGHITHKKFIVFMKEPVEVKINIFHSTTSKDPDAGTAVSESEGVRYSAPETFGGAQHNVLSDIYSFGVVANMLMLGVQPCKKGIPSSREEQVKTDYTWETPWALPGTCLEELGKLISECCSRDPADRPQTMDIVSSRVASFLERYAASRDTAIQMKPKPRSSQQEPRIPEESLCELPGVKYNRKMMGFLEQQLAKARAVNAPNSASEDSKMLFKSALKKGNRLIHNHEERVDIQTFYQSVEARDVVEFVCDLLFAVVREWELEDKIIIDTKVPPELYATDRAALGALLTFALKGEHVDSMGVAEIPQDWRDSRKEHVGRLAGLRKINDAEIHDIRSVAQGGFSVVHACTYNGQDMAMKQFVKNEGIFSIEGMAEFFKDILRQMSMSDKHVAKLHGITESGRVLMDLATKDLQSFCRERRLKWPSQLRLLLQAAERLRHMHSQNPPLIHCDVKSPNFLVFGSDAQTCGIKIADFGLTSADTTSRCKTVRRPQGSTLWVAPEVFEGQLLSLESDVYSFGMVMYEIITGKELYGLQALSRGTQHIMKKKLDGEEPCAVQKDCPKEVLELMRECCDRDPKKRPTMAMVYRRLLDLQEQWTDTVYFRYNRMCMEFLQEQMAEARKAGSSMCQAASPCHSTGTLRLDGSAEDERKAAYYNGMFFHALSLGDALTRRHAHAFDMEKFYTTTEVQEVVQKVCKNLKTCMEWWNIVGVVIHDRVPQEAVDEDVRMLDRYLGYILDTLTEPAFDDMPSSVRTEWEQAKERHREQLQSLKIVPDEEIHRQNLHQLSGSVYTAMYRGRECAVKKGMPLDNVGFARLYAEVAAMDSIQSPSVVRVYAVTRSGKLVMEKGETDIMTWFLQHRADGWKLKLKLRLLRDAAQSLSDIHDSGLLHRDVRTKIFVVFGGSQPDVKIVGFSRASTGNITAKNTVRKHGKITFAAPEIFEEKPCDMKSDIYSFGIVMYEMIGEALPYSRSSTDAAVMSMKSIGTAPCYIPADVYPEELLKLMAECCDVDPAKRPSSMGKVQRRLATLLENLVDHEVVSVQKLHAIIDDVGEMLSFIRYNKKTLTFLHGNMEKAKSLDEAAKRLITWNDLVKDMRDGRELVFRHTQAFDLWNYYTVDETVYLVNDYCRHIPGAQKNVPKGCAEDDKMFLDQRLGFVVGALEQDDVDDVDNDPFLEEWAAARSELAKQVCGVTRVRKADVGWDSMVKITPGGQDTVYRTQWDGSEVALKVSKDSLIPDYSFGELAAFWAEAALTAKFDHPHIVRVRAMSNVTQRRGTQPQGRGAHFFVMELATENLATWYKRQDVKALAMKRNVLFQAAKGLCHMHKSNVVHCDIKPQNILVFLGAQDAPPIIKLCDLSVAVGQSEIWRRMTTQKEQPGTALYKAPELFVGKRSTLKSDVFSFGMVIIEVMANSEPHVYGGGWSGMQAKMRGDLPCAIPDACTTDLSDLIKRCLSLNPDERPTMEEVKSVLEP